MLSATLQEAAFEFGLGLRQAPALAACRAAADAFNADQVAQRLLIVLREQQVGLSRLQQSGLTPSQMQIDGLRLCHAAVRANEAIMVHVQATNDAKAFLPAIAAQVSATLGADYAALVAPAGC